MAGGESRGSGNSRGVLYGGGRVNRDGGDPLESGRISSDARGVCSRVSPLSIIAWTPGLGPEVD